TASNLRRRDGLAGFEGLERGLCDAEEHASAARHQLRRQLGHTDWLEHFGARGPWSRRCTARGSTWARAHYLAFRLGTASGAAAANERGTDEVSDPPNHLCAGPYPQDRPTVKERSRSKLLGGRLVKLDGVAIGIFDLNLLTPGTYLHVVSKSDSRGLQGSHAASDAVDVEHDAVPAPWFLSSAVGHGPGTRATRSTQQQVEVAARNGRKNIAGSLGQLKTEMLGVKRDGTLDVVHVIANHRRVDSG